MDLLEILGDLVDCTAAELDCEHAVARVVSCRSGRRWCYVFALHEVPGYFRASRASAEQPPNFAQCFYRSR